MSDPRPGKKRKQSRAQEGSASQSVETSTTTGEIDPQLLASSLSNQSSENSFLQADETTGISLAESVTTIGAKDAQSSTLVPLQNEEIRRIADSSQVLAVGAVHNGNAIGTKTTQVPSPVTSRTTQARNIEVIIIDDSPEPSLFEGDDGKEDATLDPTRKLVLPLMSHDLTDNQKHLPRLLRNHFMHTDDIPIIWLRDQLMAVIRAMDHVAAALRLAMNSTLGSAHALLQMYMSDLHEAVGLNAAQDSVRGTGASLMIAYTLNTLLAQGCTPQSTGSEALDRKLERLLLNDFSGLCNDAATADFPRMIAQKSGYTGYMHAYTGTKRSPPMCNSHAAYAIQLRKGSEIQVVYLRHGMLPDRVDHMGQCMTTRLTMTLRHLAEKAAHNCRTIQNLYDKHVHLLVTEHFAE